MLRYIQLILGCALFTALIGCSAPTTSSRKPIFSSEEEIFKDMTWSGSTGKGTTFYVSMKNGVVKMKVIENSNTIEYSLYGKSSLNGNTWKAQFQHPTDSNAIYDVRIEIESDWKATGHFKSIGSSSLPDYTLNMGKWQQNNL